MSLKCPKCKKYKLQLVEHLVAPEVYYQNVAGVVTDARGEGDRCYVIKVMCFCLTCGHRWRTRKALHQIGRRRVTVPTYVDTVDDKFQSWLEGNQMGWHEEEINP